MVMQKRIAWLIVLVIAAASVSLIVATRQGRGAISVQAPERAKIKVLRRNDRLHLVPTAQEIQEDQPPPEERFLENTIPAHIPIKIKIRKEKQTAFKNMRNERWARDFELEVTNTGDKPIYELYLLLITDIKAVEGYRIVTTLSYGRSELGTISTLATSEDIPIKPGESTVLKIHPGQIEAWDIRTREDHRPLPKKIQVKFQILSFGDSTGYVGSDGAASPRNTKERSSLNPCLDPTNKGGPRFLEWAGFASSQTSSTINIPARLLPVNFLSLLSSKAPSSRPNPDPQDCCPNNGCTPLISHVVMYALTVLTKKDLRQLIAATQRDFAAHRISTQWNVLSEVARHLLVK